MILSESEICFGDRTALAESRLNTSLANDSSAGVDKAPGNILSTGREELSPTGSGELKVQRVKTRDAMQETTVMSLISQRTDSRYIWIGGSW